MEPILTNSKARHEYQLEEQHESGIVVSGTESKDIRRGKGQGRHAGCLHSNRKREGAWPVRDHDDDREETQRRDRRFLHAIASIKCLG